MRNSGRSRIAEGKNCVPTITLQDDAPSDKFEVRQGIGRERAEQHAESAVEIPLTMTLLSR